MAFQIKDFASISASMVNWLRATQQKITDFNVGSIGRSLVEAPAVEIDQLYQQMFIGLKESIPVSVYNSFNFNLITAVPASGLIRVFITPTTVPTLVPASTTFTPATGGATYSSNADVTIAIGASYADVLVTCDTSGTVGNIAAGISFTASPDIPGFTSATNVAAFASGIDTETEDERKSRFNAFVSALNRGTLDAIKYGLTLANLTDSSGNVIERVASSSIIEPWLTDPMATVSLVNAYIHNGVGSTSVALVNRAKEVAYGYTDANGVRVPGWKAAGTKLVIYAATESAVNVTGVLTAADGYDKPTLLAAAQQVIFTHIVNRGIGDDLIMSELVRLVKEIDGVFDIVFSAPSGNVAADNQTKLMPGTIALT